MRWLFGVFGLPLAAFCAYGFLASFEPGPNALEFRVAYLSIGFASLFGFFWAIRRRREAPPY